MTKEHKKNNSTYNIAMCGVLTALAMIFSYIESIIPVPIPVPGIKLGVASNSALRKALSEECDKNNIKFYSPSPILCTDNAAMIGCAAYYEYMAGTRHGYDLNAVPNLKLGERI